MRLLRIPPTTVSISSPEESRSRAKEEPLESGTVAQVQALENVEPLLPVPQTLEPTMLVDEMISQAPLPVVEPLRLNLPTALALVGGRHPAIGLAKWRVQEAYARFEQAKVMWLPSIQPGFSFHRHDGNYQASDGSIVDVNRNSFQYGLGTGATGAGTTPRPWRCRPVPLG